MSSHQEALDRLMTLDFNGRGIERLYTAARKHLGRPLAWAAGELLAGVPPGSFVILGTGWLTRGWISTRIAESDGPPGAAAVARALALARDVVSVVLAEEGILTAIGSVFRAAGLSPLDLEEAGRLRRPGGELPGVVLLPFPTDDQLVGAEAERLLDRLKPVLCFATERASRSRTGIYHNARGVDIGAGVARVDLLFEEAGRRGIPTIGVGDGGNEIGMGLVAEAVAENVRFGDRCQCGCGGGIGARTSTDVLVTSNCCNWGCYAAVAALAIQLSDTSLLHTAERERLLLETAVMAGLLNSPRGTVDPNVDDVPLASHLAVVELLHELAVRAIGRA